MMQDKDCCKRVLTDRGDQLHGYFCSHHLFGTHLYCAGHSSFPKLGDSPVWCQDSILTRRPNRGHIHGTAGGSKGKREGNMGLQTSQVTLQTTTGRTLLVHMTEWWDLQNRLHKSQHWPQHICQAEQQRECNGHHSCWWHGSCSK